MVEGAQRWARNSGPNYALSQDPPCWKGKSRRPLCVSHAAAVETHAVSPPRALVFDHIFLFLLSKSGYLEITMEIAMETQRFSAEGSRNSSGTTSINSFS